MTHLDEIRFQKIFNGELLGAITIEYLDDGYRSRTVNLSLQDKEYNKEALNEIQQLIKRVFEDLDTDGE